LQTHLGKALAVVLGHTDEVQSLDSRHYQLKQMKKQNNQMKNKHLENLYRDSLANIQVKVLSEKTIAEKKLKAWEKDYVLNNDLKTPSLEEMKLDKEASVFLNKIKYANALVKEWKINF